MIGLKKSLSHGKNIGTTYIDRIVKSRLLSKKSTKELIDNIFSSSKLTFYFNQLSRSSKQKRLLFLHRFDLFGFEDEMRISYLHLCNIPKSNNDNEKVTRNESKALQHFVSNELEVVNQGMNILNMMFGIDKSQWDTFLEDFKDVVAYFVILFIRSNPNLKDLINAKNFDYKRMKDVLRKYRELFEKYELKIICPDEIEETIEEMK